jgi:hypothetical protein
MQELPLGSDSDICADQSRVVGELGCQLARRDALGYSTKTIERHARGAAAYAEYVATRE